jgi:tRNA G18 (ribose-2'-O)-methylase SpoU
MPTLVEIHDPDDPRIEHYRDIRERDLVGRAGLFVAEGKVVVEKLVGSALHRPLSMLIATKRLDGLRALLADLPEDVPVFLAIGRRVETPDADALLARWRGDGDVLVLAGIANHDNMGGIFRNAAAFGVAAVLLDADCCDPLYRKAIRVSVGASLLVPTARLDRGEDVLALLKRHAFEPFSLSPAGTTLLTDWRPTRRNAMLLGAEGPGLSPDVLQRTHSLRIAMASAFDSLNVATTSGIVLHHLTHARG